MMGSLDYARRKLVVTTSRTKRSADFIDHLRLLDRLYGPKPGAPFKPVVLVLDNGPIHLSKATLTALAERAHWLVVEWLPKYTPELNDIEVVWGDLKARHLAHQTFTDPGLLDETVHCAVATLNSQRSRIPLANQRISA
jgi:transposase